MSKPTEPKYSKKTSFNRQKKYANSAMDIEKFDKKNEEYKNVRGYERNHNLKIASGKEDIKHNDSVFELPLGVTAASRPLEEDNSHTDVIVVNNEPPFYFEKMNFIISGIPFAKNTMTSMDTILREFSPYGKILYITQLVSDSCKLVIDYWYDEDTIDMSFIIEVQNAILKNGIYNWFCIDDAQINISKDPEQSIKSMGCKIVLEEETY